MLSRPLKAVIAATILTACSPETDRSNTTSRPSIEFQTEEKSTSQENLEHKLQGMWVFSTDESYDFLKANSGVKVTAVNGALRLTGGNPNAISGGRTGGALLTIKENDESIIGGNRLVVTISAKGSPSASFKAAYSTSQLGNSGWRTFELTEEYENYSFEYNVPPVRDLQKDYLGILPLTGYIDVRAISLDLVDR